MKYEMGHPRVWLWRKGFSGVLVCSCVFALPLQAGDPAAERRLNEVYTELRHTLTPAQKEALKQEELDWLKQRDRFSSADPRWAELTEGRIRELEARLSGASKVPPTHQTQSSAVSPDGQYVVVQSTPSGRGAGPEIELRTVGGETVTTLYSGAQVSFKAYWSADSAHLVIIALNRSGGRRDDTMALAEKVYGQWASVGYSLPLTQGSGVIFLNWVSPDTARLQCGNRVVTMPFPKPTKFGFQTDRFSSLTLETESGSEKVSFETGDKRGSEVVFASPVKPAGAMSYVSPHGTRFRLEKLGRPLINDANRKINSGDWKLTLSGDGDEYLSLKGKIGAPSFGDTGKTEYYGEVELNAEGK